MNNNGTTYEVTCRGETVYTGADNDAARRAAYGVRGGMLHTLRNGVTVRSERIGK